MKIQKPLWNILILFSKYFYETGAYLTNESIDGRPWEAVLEEDYGLWSFDAAIIPLIIEKLYKDVPSNFIKKVMDGKAYPANGDIWDYVPGMNKINSCLFTQSRQAMLVQKIGHSP